MNEYGPKIDILVKKLLLLAEDSDDWNLVTEQTDLKVFKLEGTANCFKVVAELGSSQEAAFDILADISCRSSWDDMCENGKLIEQVNGSTKVQYMKTKGKYNKTLINPKQCGQQPLGTWSVLGTWEHFPMVTNQSK